MRCTCTARPRSLLPRSLPFENLVIPQDQWVISGHVTTLVTPDVPGHGDMVAAGGVSSAALLHQGSIALGEIDLTGIDYNGPLYLIHDSLTGGFALVYSIEFVE